MFELDIQYYHYYQLPSPLLGSLRSPPRSAHLLLGPRNDVPNENPTVQAARHELFIPVLENDTPDLAVVAPHGTNQIAAVGAVDLHGGVVRHGEVLSSVAEGHLLAALDGQIPNGPDVVHQNTAESDSAGEGYQHVQPGGVKGDGESLKRAVLESFNSTKNIQSFSSYLLVKHLHELHGLLDVVPHPDTPV